MEEKRARDKESLVKTAQLFKVLGNESRLELLKVIGEGPSTVGALVEATAISQPLVSQHLRTLRQAHLVASQRQGKEVEYHLTDYHVSHIIDDALEHAKEMNS